MDIVQIANNIDDQNKSNRIFNHMKFQKLLEKQINELLPEHLRNEPAMLKFLEAVNESYQDIENKLTEEEGPAGKNDKDILSKIIFREKIFNSVINNLKNGVLLVNEAGEIIDCNDNFLDIFNTTIKREDIKGQYEKDFFIENGSIFGDTKSFISGVEKILEKKIPHFDEIFRTEKNEFYERDFSPIYYKGDYLGHLWIYTDITKKKREQDSIVQNEFTQRQILNSAIDAIIIVNEEGVIEFWNPQAEKIFGWKFNEVYDKFLSENITPVSIKEPNDKGVKKYLTKTNKNINADLNEIVSTNKEGAKIYIQISTISIKYHERDYYCSFIRDITIKRNYENELTKQKKFTEDVLNHLPADIAVFDRNHNYLFVNPMAIKSKETREWIIGKNDFEYCEMKGLNNQSAVERRGLFNKAISTKKTVQWIDEVVNKNNDKFYILRNFYPYEEDGEIKYIFGYGIDITEMRSVQLKLNETLLDLKNINEELEQFAYIISHDLQEPLRMVKSFLQLLEKKLGNSLDDTDKRYINFAVNGADRMKKHIQDLLEYSRIGKKTEEVDDVNCNEILQEINTIFQLKIRETNTTLTIHPLPVIKALRSGMYHLFQNLIANAIKFQRNDIEQHTVEVGYTEVDNSWQFYVRDNGLGIEPKYFERIFILFQRLENGKEGKAGTGIGLAVCKKIVEQLNGKIWVESEVGKGSTFYFKIPKHNG